MLVLIHGDRDWPEVDRRIVALIEKYIPEVDRAGFVFHATDIFHGSGYFDRRTMEWSNPERRIIILNELAEIIGDLSLPVVIGDYEKLNFGAAALPPYSKDMLIHDMAALRCLVYADKWLADFAPRELATVIHEDGTEAKSLIKKTVRFARSVDRVKANLKPFGLPLKRIIDTVQFAEKPDARPLQLADLCAFVIGRGLKDKTVPPHAEQIIFRNARWVMKYDTPPIPDVQVSDASVGCE